MIFNTLSNVSEFIIIGSGPASVSAAWPLVLRGKEVLMLDAGDAKVKNYNNNNKTLFELRNESNNTFFLGGSLEKLNNEI